MPQSYDTRKSLVALDQDSTLIAVIEMSEETWLVAGIVPGIERQPLKKLGPDADALIRLLERWRAAGAKAGGAISRLVVAYETGRDGFWLARHLREHGIEVHVIHAASVAVARTHRRAKTDRLDTNMLKRAFIGWLRGEPDHCTMAPIPTRDAEDARRPSREREKLTGERTRLVNRMKAALARFGVRNFNPKLKKAPERLADVRMPDGRALPPHTLAELKRTMTRARLLSDQIKEIEADRLARLDAAPEAGTHAMVRVLARVHGIGVETADMLVHEILSRDLPNRRAVARYGGLTGAPDESGKRRREKGLARAGNARVRRGMIQLAWRFLRFQADSALACWYRVRTEGATRGRRKALIVALARKLLIALWRLVTTGETPDGVVLRPAV
jgi:transposase